MKNAFEVEIGKDYYYKFRDISFDIKIRGEQIKCKGNQLYIRCFVPIDFSDANDGDEFELGNDFTLLSVLRINKDKEEVKVEELESAQKIIGDLRFEGYPREKGQNKWIPVCVVNKPRYVKDIDHMIDYSFLANQPNAVLNKWHLYHNAGYSSSSKGGADEKIIWREGLLDEYELIQPYYDNLLIIYRIIIFLIREKLEERNLKLTEKEWVDILNTALKKFSRIKDFSELHWNFMHLYTRWCGLTEGEYYKWY